jgi:preprotein translocase subunit SecE
MAEALAKVSAPTRLIRFYREVVAEMKRITWPDQTQVRQLSIGVVLLSLFIGGVIFLMDRTLQVILVSAIPALLGR